MHALLVIVSLALARPAISQQIWDFVGVFESFHPHLLINGLPIVANDMGSLKAVHVVSTIDTN